jgi:hypothetical protein
MPKIRLLSSADPGSSELVRGPEPACGRVERINARLRHRALSVLQPKLSDGDLGAVDRGMGTKLNCEVALKTGPGAWADSGC